MEIEAIGQCDAELEGGRRKALFPGQRYELPEAVAAALVERGEVRVVGGTAAGAGVRVTSRAQGGRR